MMFSKRVVVKGGCYLGTHVSGTWLLDPCNRAHGFCRSHDGVCVIIFRAGRCFRISGLLKFLRENIHTDVLGIYGDFIRRFHVLVSLQAGLAILIRLIMLDQKPLKQEKNGARPFGRHRFSFALSPLAQQHHLKYFTHLVAQQ
ncbi:hypothetical protein D3C78_960100 [compost metagenome]